jgi:N-alpha-acetyltransferase 50
MVSNTLKVPLVGELPPPDKRVFDNSSQEKPSRKLVTIDDIKFGEVNSKNFEMLRIINYLTLPVIYSENFYEYLTSMRRYSKLAYFKDVLVGGISCKEDIEKSGEHICYIMTINVLKPYQRYGIGSKLLKQAIDDCVMKREVKRMRLHVQSGNDAALAFYQKNGFEVVEELKDYYTDLTPSDCFVLERLCKSD